MESDKWFKDRKAGETLLRALGGVTPEALKTLQDMELDRVIVLLATMTAVAGAERAQR